MRLFRTLPHLVAARSLVDTTVSALTAYAYTTTSIKTRRPPFVRYAPHVVRGDDVAVAVAARSSSSSRTSLGSSSSSSSSSWTGTRDLASLGAELTAAMTACPEHFKDVAVRVGPSPAGHRLGLLATKALRPGEPALSVPYDDAVVITAERAETSLRAAGADVPETIDAWTGDAGSIAVGLLCEVAAARGLPGAAATVPRRSAAADRVVAAWVAALPTPEELRHPLRGWTEDEQETLQFSSTRKIYDRLDDVDEDAAWWEETVWAPRRDVFSSDVFDADHFRWALALVDSRAAFLDGELRLVPVLDFANHGDGAGAENVPLEISGDGLGPFGTTRGARARAPSGTDGGVAANEEVLVSYGPKSPADYLSEHGFVPDRAVRTATRPSVAVDPTTRRLCEVVELSFRAAEDDRFSDDKSDVLEVHAGLPNPTQSFDLTSADDPDPALSRFLRLLELGGADSFLLEAVFRNDVWDFMALPVSRPNEEAVLRRLAAACRTALDDAETDDDDDDDEVPASLVENPPSLEEVRASPALACAVVRELERRALLETIAFCESDLEALDLKEYYQERRLRDLGLDGEYNEDEDNPDVGWGQTRAPGGGDLDW